MPYILAVDNDCYIFGTDTEVPGRMRDKESSPQGSGYPADFLAPRVYLFGRLFDELQVVLSADQRLICARFQIVDTLRVFGEK